MTHSEYTSERNRAFGKLIAHIEILRIHGRVYGCSPEVEECIIAAKKAVDDWEELDTNYMQELAQQ